MKPRVLSTVALLGCAASLCALSGCGAGTGDVTGVVTYNGKPLVMGNVSIVGSDGLPHNGPIGPDGRYVVSGVAIGAAKATVSSPNPSGQPEGRGGSANRKSAEGRGAKEGREAPKQAPAAPADAALAKQWIAIPDAYSDPMKSNLATVVKAGANSFDINLK